MRHVPLFENTLLITSVYKGAEVIHRLLVVISQKKNYDREEFENERSARVYRYLNTLMVLVRLIPNEVGE